MALTRDGLFWSSFASHAERSVGAARLLEQMLLRPAEAPGLYRAVRDLEREGDRLTHDVVTELHKTWITPLDRESIHDLICALDDVLDYIDAAAEFVTLYEIKEARPESLELARLLIAAAQEVAKAVPALSKRGDPKSLLDSCAAIGEHERVADAVYRRALARLFKERTDPLEAMKWRDIFESLETASDRLEDVANVIEGIVLEHA